MSADKSRTVIGASKKSVTVETYACQEKRFHAVTAYTDCCLALANLRLGRKRPSSLANVMASERDLDALCSSPNKLNTMEMA